MKKMYDRPTAPRMYWSLLEALLFPDGAGIAMKMTTMPSMLNAALPSCELRRKRSAAHPVMVSTMRGKRRKASMMRLSVNAPRARCFQSSSALLCSPAADPYAWEGAMSEKSDKPPSSGDAVTLCDKDLGFVASS
jgi:hypothetical protein